MTENIVDAGVQLLSQLYKDFRRRVLDTCFIGADCFLRDTDLFAESVLCEILFSAKLLNAVFMRESIPFV